MKFGLIGETLGHSLSPQIHRCIFKTMGQDHQYDLLEIPQSCLAGRLQALSRDYRGLNVTIPYKVAVMPYLKEIAPAARRIGAVNTIQIRPDGWYGYNTDYTGFNRTLDRSRIHPQRQPVVVLGTGGAARAVIQCLADREAASITVVTRHPEQISRDFQAYADRLSLTLTGYDELARRPGQYLLVNCTPVGMYPHIAASPVPEAVAASYEAVVDVIYNPQESLLLQYGRRHGAITQNGLYMLVAQAAAAEEIWQNRPIDGPVVETIIREMEQIL